MSPRLGGMMPGELLDALSCFEPKDNELKAILDRTSHIVKVVQFLDDNPMGFSVDSMNGTIGETAYSSFDEFIVCVRINAAMTLSNRLFTKGGVNNGIYNYFLCSLGGTEIKALHSKVQAVTNSYNNRFSVINRRVKQSGDFHKIARLSEERRSLIRLDYAPDWEDKLIIDNRPSLGKKFFTSERKSKIFDYMNSPNNVGKNLSALSIRSELGLPIGAFGSIMKELIVQLRQISNEYIIEIPGPGLYRLVDLANENKDRLGATTPERLLKGESLSLALELSKTEFPDINFDFDSLQIDGISFTLDEMILSFLTRYWEGKISFNTLMSEHIILREEIIEIVSAINNRFTFGGKSLRVSAKGMKLKFIEEDMPQFDIPDREIKKGITLPGFPF